MKIISMILSMIFKTIGFVIKIGFFAVKTILTFTLLVLSVGLLGSRTQSF
ncbi:hypothetical protein [Enterococcus sp. AZ196]